MFKQGFFSEKHMSSHWEYQEKVVAQHDAEKPFAPENGEPLKFAVGDVVAFTNEYGVMFRGIRVTGFYKPDPINSLYATGRRYLLDRNARQAPALQAGEG